MEKLGVETMELAAALWEVAFRRYNQSLRGLRAAGYKLDENAYWEFIRAGADRFLTPDSGVKALLESLPQRKWLFTNCRELEAKQALTLLGLDGFFEGIIGADAMGARPPARARRVGDAASRAPGPASTALAARQGSAASRTRRCFDERSPRRAWTRGGRLCSRTARRTSRLQRGSECTRF